jgi:putative membrane protein
VATYVIYKLTQKVNFSQWALWGYSIWAILHLFGGGLTIGDTRLYDLMLINLVGEPYNVFKYDQFVHFFCYVAFGLLLAEASVHYKILKTKFSFFVVMLAALGLGALNEVIEFGAVVFLDAADGVGGYYNTALDLVFNSVGAIVGVLLVKYSKKTNLTKKK